MLSSQESQAWCQGAIASGLATLIPFLEGQAAYMYMPPYLNVLLRFSYSRDWRGTKLRSTGSHYVATAGVLDGQDLRK
ncbi:hypothetical protein K431DRAFT_98412 [Polychaeton citri CBS 116435]|uniref:Uncharacterized protein n=1 Tax=Polychaeton citri CBS 116435 TaxID=1314669 RepID=A0A9P4QGG8_9PEZI|nr:hypothetical protein K431DRAFT_98412 [Polychaeton citri CBS 116435]